jgi:hypothetical protein
MEPGSKDAAAILAHERGVAAFLLPARAARFKATIGSERGRRKIRARLPHHASDFDPRYAKELPSAFRVQDIAKVLRAAGAPTRCYVLAGGSDLDGQLVDLQDALSDAVGYGGALISCIPGRLGLFADEGPGSQWLLRRGENR